MTDLPRYLQQGGVKRDPKHTQKKKKTPKNENFGKKKRIFPPFFYIFCEFQKKSKMDIWVGGEGGVCKMSLPGFYQIVNHW